MLLSPRKNGLTSLFKEVRVFKVDVVHLKRKHLVRVAAFLAGIPSVAKGGGALLNHKYL